MEDRHRHRGGNLPDQLQRECRDRTPDLLPFDWPLSREFQVQTSSLFPAAPPEVELGIGQDDEHLDLPRRDRRSETPRHDLLYVDYGTTPSYGSTYARVQRHPGRAERTPNWSPVRDSLVLSPGTLDTTSGLWRPTARAPRAPPTTRWRSPGSTPADGDSPCHRQTWRQPLRNSGAQPTRTATPPPSGSNGGRPRPTALRQRVARSAAGTTAVTLEPLVSPTTTHHLPLSPRRSEQSVGTVYGDDQTLRDHSAPAAGCRGGSAAFHQPWCPSDDRWRPLLQSLLTGWRRALHLRLDSDQRPE